MTEKRLNIDLIEDLFVREELIRLYEENEQLKKQVNELQGKASSWKITASEEIMEKQGLMKQIEKLNSENEMLKFTNARNESYIEKLTHKGEWSN